MLVLRYLWTTTQVTLEVALLAKPPKAALTSTRVFPAGIPLQLALRSGWRRWRGYVGASTTGRHWWGSIVFTPIIHLLPLPLLTEDLYLRFYGSSPSWPPAYRKRWRHRGHLDLRLRAGTRREVWEWMYDAEGLRPGAARTQGGDQVVNFVVTVRNTIFLIFVKNQLSRDGADIREPGGYRIGCELPHFDGAFQNKLIAALD
jgi:hypothetical protein